MTRLTVPSVHRWSRAVGVRSTLVGVLLAVLLLSPTRPHAAVAAERPNPPILIAVEGETEPLGNGAERAVLRIRWEIEAQEPPVKALAINVYDESGSHVGNFTEQSSPPSVPLDLSGIHEIRGASGIKPGMRYCVSIEARIGDGTAPNAFSEPTERQCVTIPGRPNLVISEIRGKEDIEWAATNQRTPVYIFMLRNDGGDATDRVVVEIKTSGVVRIADEQLPILVQGWESNGFTCERIGVSGGANAGLLCNGGTLKAGQEINPAILTRVTGRGFGAVHVVINVSRGRGDSDPGDNSLTLNVQVS